jgi:hypothetical protein
VDSRPEHIRGNWVRVGVLRGIFESYRRVDRRGALDLWTLALAFWFQSLERDSVELALEIVTHDLAARDVLSYYPESDPLEG